MVKWFGRGFDFPRWPRNDMGSPMVPSMGKIKLCDVTWEYPDGSKIWIAHVYQTALFLGTSCPSESSRDRQSKKGKGQGKNGKGKYKKGKGKKYRGKVPKGKGKKPKAKCKKPMFTKDRNRGR